MYRIQADERKIKKVKRICRRRRYEFVRMYPENMGRSDRYRRVFFQSVPRPAGGYRCRYCHRRLSDRKITIDHIYPVYRAKTGDDRWLRLLGIEDVNDVRNLAPACARCNRKKGSQAGIWVLRAILGRYELYWVIKRMLQAIVLMVLIMLLARGYSLAQTGLVYLKNFSVEFPQWISGLIR